MLYFVNQYPHPTPWQLRPNTVPCKVGERQIFIDQTFITMAVQDNYRLLVVDKLDQFIRKYYTNQIIHGALFTIGSVLLIFLAYNLLWASVLFLVKVSVKLLYYSFNLFAAGSLIYWWQFLWCIIFKLGQVISHEQAARIIGDHFGDVQDRLL